MALLPPGALLQLMYLKERLLPLKPARFVEIGPGAGHVSELLLSMGWVGQGYDVQPSTITALETRFQNEIESGRCKVVL